MKKLTIGIEVVPSHAFGRAFVEGVSRLAVEQKNWRLRALQQDTLSVARLKSCDGAILRIFNDAGERIVKAAGIPVVDVFCARPRSGIAQLSTDEPAAGEMAAEFFLARGFKNFGCCGVNEYAYSDICLNAFVKRVERAGFPVSCYQCPSRFRGVDIIDNGSPYHTPDAASIRKWLKSLPKPAAVFCCNDHRAYQVMDTALKAGIDIPHEVAIIGCDNDTMLCSFAPVPITSVDPDAERIGYTAARVLNAILQRRPAEKIHRSLLIPPKGIVERESSEYVPISPAWLSEAILLIERELESGLSAERIFALSGHSAPHVEKVFREKLGVSVQTYITNARMKRARALLRDGKLSTKEIAAACGYASPQYFCRVFKELFGFSPQKLSGHPPAS